MNKKPGLLFTVCVLAVILLAAAFNMGLGGNEIAHLRSGINPDNVLYVCPIANHSWDTFSRVLTTGHKTLYMGFAFFLIILLFSWGWALYQNLLKDKFSSDVYKNPWGLTKVFFWAVVICTILTMTPNYFRSVKVGKSASSANWVLCESNSEGARPVNPRAVGLR